MTMGVPNISAVAPGASVNIILKADQKSGTLTNGYVKDVLTRGNHPRGIKVRLSDGQIGRVQSLRPPSVTTTSTTLVEPVYKSSHECGSSVVQNPPPSNNARIRPVHMQDDYRNNPAPAEERSLEDYVTIKPAKSKQKRPKRSAASTPTEHSKTVLDPQEALQGEFPHVDSALIAAILGDSASVEEARSVLTSVS